MPGCRKRKNYTGSLGGLGVWSPPLDVNLKKGILLHHFKIIIFEKKKKMSHKSKVLKCQGWMPLLDLVCACVCVCVAYGRMADQSLFDYFEEDADLLCS